MADRPPPTPAHVAVQRNRQHSALPMAVGALIVAALIVLIVVLLMHFNNGDSHAHAPWDDPGAPVVHPAPITDQ